MIGGNEIHPVLAAFIVTLILGVIVLFVVQMLSIAKPARAEDDSRKVPMKCKDGIKIEVLVTCADAQQASGRGRFDYKIGLPHRKKRIQTMPLEVKITNEQQIRVTLSPKTDTGKPATLDGMPSWAVISGNSQMQVSDDGMSALLVSADDPGDTEILVKADADLGEGVEEISDIIKLSVVGATAKNLGLSAGQPEAKPTPTPA